MVTSPQPFFVLALPRSRTAWLSAFLSYPPLKCGHDTIIECDTAADFATAMQSLAGTVETGLVDVWSVLMHRWPEARYVAIKRPVPYVMASLARQGFCADPRQIEVRAMRIDEFSRRPGVKTYSFTDLILEEACREIFEFCLQRPFDRGWWLGLRDHDIQIDVAARKTRLVERRGAIEKLRAEAVCA